MHQNHFPCVFPCQAKMKKHLTEGTELRKEETELWVDTHLNGETANKEAKAEMSWLGN